MVFAPRKAKKISSDPASGSPRSIEGLAWPLPLLQWCRLEVPVVLQDRAPMARQIDARPADLVDRCPTLGGAI
jgi:hypothetical protein